MEKTLIGENKIIHILLSSKDRLFNPGKLSLELIEIQICAPLE